MHAEFRFGRQGKTTASKRPSKEIVRNVVRHGKVSLDAERLDTKHKEQP
ncbi:MAG: hypothetical protein V3V01_16300 [Acidimicrobiales bacterium]